MIPEGILMVFSAAQKIYNFFLNKKNFYKKMNMKDPKT